LLLRGVFIKFVAEHWVVKFCLPFNKTRVVGKNTGEVVESLLFWHEANDVDKLEASSGKRGSSLVCAR